MGIEWVRVDANLAQNPKLLALAKAKKWRAIAVFVFGLGYAGANATDGWIPEAALVFVHATPVEAVILVKAGLWEDAPGGWWIHDWADYQPTKLTAAELSERGRQAANMRWHGTPNGHAKF